MKKKILGILLIAIAVVGLTGCGSEEKGDSRFDYIIDHLNNAVDELLERNSNSSVSITRIEDRLYQNISSARVIACGDEKFTKDVDLTQTSYQNKLDGYDGKIIYSSSPLKEDSANYCLIFDSQSKGYLNIKVTYEKVTDDVYKPIFSVPVVLNEQN